MYKISKIFTMEPKKMMVCLEDDFPPGARILRWTISYSSERVGKKYPF